MDYFIVQFYELIDFDKMIELITSIHIVVFEVLRDLSYNITKC